MTRASAKEILDSTRLFRQVDDTVALREVALIEAVRKCECALVPLSKVKHVARQSPRAA